MAELTRRFDLFAPTGSDNTPLWLAAETRLQIGAIRDGSGVTVHDDMNEEGFFPDRWHKPPVTVHAHPLDPVMTWLTVPLVREFLIRYPPAIIRRNLSDIYLVDRFNLRGKWYGGTYGASSIYAAVGHNPKIILNVLHHEFSSILMRNYAFPEDTWRAINAPEWTYTGTGFELLGLPGNNRQTEEMLVQGFLSRYAQSSLENDVNVMTEWITGRPEELKAIAETHERVRKKRDLLMQFYSEVFSGKRPFATARATQPGRKTGNGTVP